MVSLDRAGRLGEEWGTQGANARRSGWRQSPWQRPRSVCCRSAGAQHDDAGLRELMIMRTVTSSAYEWTQHCAWQLPAGVRPEMSWQWRLAGIGPVARRTARWLPPTRPSGEAISDTTWAEVTAHSGARPASGFIVAADNWTMFFILLKLKIPVEDGVAVRRPTASPRRRHQDNGAPSLSARS